MKPETDPAHSPLRPRIRDFVVPDGNGGVPGLFRDRRIGYAFSTRVAIRKACDLLDLRPGDEILAPAYNCGSELDPLLHAGLKVSLYPVDRQARIDLAGVEARITERTRAVYLTHYFGILQPETAALRALCDRHRLFLIEDCALSLLSGASPAEGHSGDVALFCFYKFFPVVTGGALVVNNAALPGAPRFVGRAPAGQVFKDRLRLASGTVLSPAVATALKRLRRRAGTPPESAASGDRPDMPPDYYFDPRLREARIDPFARRPLGGFDIRDTICRRRDNYRTYLRLLAGAGGAEPLFPDLPDTACPHSMPVLVAGRDRIAARLMQDGIAATPWWSGYNRHLNWDEACGDALFLKDNVLSLPLHQALSAEAVASVVDHLLRALRS